MSTLEELVSANALVKHDPNLEVDEMPERHVYFSPDFDAWLRNVLPHEQRDRGRTLDPYEQVEAILYDFIIGRPMAYDVHYKRLDPIMKHVWELKSLDVRLIGWFARRRHLLLVSGEMKNRLRKKSLYTPYVMKVDDFRASLDLDEPKSIIGVGHDKVL